MSLVVFVEASTTHASVNLVVAIRHALRHFTHEGNVPEAAATTGLCIDEDRCTHDIAEVFEGGPQRLVRRPAAFSPDQQGACPDSCPCACRGACAGPGRTRR